MKFKHTQTHTQRRTRGNRGKSALINFQMVSATSSCATEPKRSSKFSKISQRTAHKSESTLLPFHSLHFSQFRHESISIFRIENLRRCVFGQFLNFRNSHRFENMHGITAILITHTRTQLRIPCSNNQLVFIASWRGVRGAYLYSKLRTNPINFNPIAIFAIQTIWLAGALVRQSRATTIRIGIRPLHVACAAVHFNARDWPKREVAFVVAPKPGICEWRKECTAPVLYVSMNF